ncbi:MAG: GTPase [Candidatus Latescibacter sp.]|nr:GTPase [Candidatus Latescibacter sp.]
MEKNITNRNVFFGTGELVTRDNICICGRMNAGKSTLMNLITGQETSIVDSTPGTTADVKTTVMEIHDFGPVKLFDTAGLDETTVLGQKKQEKSIIALKESDLVILVVDPTQTVLPGNMLIEKRILRLAKEYGKQAFVLFNMHYDSGMEENDLRPLVSELFLRDKYPCLSAVLIEASSKQRILDFIKEHYRRSEKKVDLLPFLGTSGFVALNIPVDEETPEGRLLRPQNVVLDYILRHYLPFAGYRMNLTNGRSSNTTLHEAEKENYRRFLHELQGEEVGLQLIITDSQAIDLIDLWTPEDIPVTTFSIIMAHHQSRGSLRTLAQGLSVMKTLESGDRVLIAELCNHDRKAEDIGTKQIPRLLNKLYGNIYVDFAEGRVFPSESELDAYKLIIQCGGCMVDQQKYSTRIEDARRLGIPITNYGLILSWLNNPKTLERVLKPWGIGVN